MADPCLAGALRLPLLTPEQELLLGRQVRAWQDHPNGPDKAPAQIRRAGIRAAQRFTASNLRLALAMAKRHLDRGVAFEDLYQAAAMGVHTAVLRFDPALGYRASSYLCWYAQQACQNLCSRQGGVMRLPAHAMEKLRQLSRADEKLRQRFNRTPTLKELAAEAGMAPEQAELMLLTRKRQHKVSLELGSRDDEDGSNDNFLVRLADEEATPLEALLHADMREQLMAAIRAGLDQQQQYIIRQRWLQAAQKSVSTVASDLNISRRRVQLLENDALQTLKRFFQTDVESTRQGDAECKDWCSTTEKRAETQRAEAAAA